jgi:1-aminocyclopropane-1-carboxylate deaminase
MTTIALAPAARAREATRLKLDRFPRHKLTFGPSPIERMDRLTAYLGGQVEIYAKREDCNSGLAFGGNKIRKLEYLVPEALEQGCDTLVSIGGVQSNHTRQVAAVAAKLGLKCRLVQESWVNWHDSIYDRVGNILLSRIMGAHVQLVDEGFGIEFKRSWEDALEDVRRAGGRPYAIPAGASDHRFGGLGFVGWAEEVRAQEAELGFAFDYIIVCSVTGSTQAGMVVGFAADGRADRVIGIDASGEPQKTRDQIKRIAQRTADLVELAREITDADIVLDTRFAAPEYGLPSEGTLEAIRLSARLDGMLTDPVYEGKSMHGMIELIKDGTIPPGSKVLYAHLGGVPAINGYSYLFRNG